MKIAFIVNSFPNLTETFITNQILGLLAIGNDIEIFAFKDPKLKRIHNYIKDYNLIDKVHYINIPENKIIRILKALKIIITTFFKDPIFILKALNIFKYRSKALSLKLLFLYKFKPFFKKNFDLIHCFYGTNGIWGIFLKDTGFFKGKVITSFHGYDITGYTSRYGNNVYNFLFKKGDYFLCVSEYFKNKLIKFGCDKNKIYVHRTGIDLNKFKYIERNNSRNTVKIISIGRLIEKKGFEYAVTAISKIIKAFSNIEYNIIGEGILESKIQQLINRLSINDKIKIYKFKTHDEIIKLLNESDMLLSPSITSKDGDQEGIPNVLKEAMATGLPVVATEHSGIPELVKDGETGFLVPEKNTDMLAEKILYLAEHYEVRKKMGINGRKFIEKNYDLKLLNKKLDSFYKEIIGI